jgi:diguanylate cyclase (GGDEF)-like protein/PAS domain S-box-containing protein
VALCDSLAAGVGARGLNGRSRSEKQPITSLKWPHRTHPGILDLLPDSEASGEPMGMKPIEPDPNNPSDDAPTRVEGLPRARGTSRGERWFRSLVQNSSDVMMILEADGTVRYVSPAVERVLGYRPEEMVGSLALDYVHPEDVEYMSESFADTLEKPGVHPPIEYRVRTADGSWRHMEAIRSNRLADPHVAGVVANVRDVTERKKAEEALKESEERYRMVVEQSVEAIYLYDAETKRILEANAAFQRLIGYVEEELLGMRIYDFIAHADEDIDRQVRRSLKEKRRYIGERRYRRKDGSVIFVDTSASVISYGGRTALCAVSRDVTERRVAEETVRRSEIRLAETQRLAHLGGWEWDVRTDEISWSDEVYRIYGLAPQSAVPSVERFMGIVHPDDRELVGKAIDGALYESKPYDVEHRVVRPDGEVRVVHRRAEVVRGEGGEPLRMIGTVHDITERKEAEERLREAEERYRTVVEAQTELVCRFLPDLTLTFVNEAYCRYFGRTPGEVIGRSFVERVPVEDRVYYEEQLTRLNKEDPRRTIEHRVLTPEGGVRWQQWTDTAIFDGEGRIVEYQSVGRDVTERKALEEKLEHQALHDSLTGLPNRQLLVDRFKQSLSRTRRRRGRKVGVLFMDLDGFKVVNDSLGHDTGDRLLVEVAERLKGCLRPEDTLARFGGDEFIVLIEEVEGADDALRITQRITEEFRGPFVLDGRELVVRFSIGVALGDAHTKSPEELLRNADAAMYRAKEDAVDYRVFDPQMHEQALSRLELENDLRHALEKEEFTIYYQPKFRLGQKDRVEGIEALVRWEHPQRGLMLPEDFIPVAEETGLIISIGGWVMREACRKAKEWQERYPSEPPLSVCVNLSAGQVRHPGLLQDVRSTLRESGLEAGYLILEITEGTLLKDTEMIETVFRELKALGVRLAIDDFGKEYSSLSYLKRLPVDSLKIDGSFIGSLGEDPSNTTIVEAVISLAHSLGLEVTGEEVETAEQLEHLRRMGCDLVQGDHLARPLPSEEVGQLLADLFTELE